MFRVVVEKRKLDQELDGLVQQARDIGLPLRKFGSRIRGRAIGRWEAQDLAPLAESTLEKRGQKAVRSVEVKLNRDLRKAKGRADGQVTRGVLNRMAVIAEFQRRHRGGGSLAQRAGLAPLTFKQAQSLDQRTERALVKAAGKRILGNVAGMLESKATEDGVTVTWRTRQGWTEIHNEGGVAGHGAKIPKREVLSPPDEEDLGAFGQILKEHLLLPFGKR